MFYYDTNIASTTNGTANTENKEEYLLTVANQRTAALMGMYISGRMASAGGLVMRSKVFPTTAPSGGTAYTPGKRDPDAPAASTTAGTGAYTVGTGTPKIRQIVGCAAQGGFGGWFAATLEQSHLLKPNGGVNGHIEFYSLCGLVSTQFDFNTEFVEA